jgi:hypothetical protein
VRCSCCRVGDAHSTDFNRLFSLLSYDFFSPSPPKPCGYCTCLIMVQHVSFSPSLYSLHHSMTRFTRNDLRDLRREGQANWPFLLQVDVAGDGYTTNNIKMNTKWLRNTSRSYPNYTPLHHTFYVMISVTFERKGHAKCGLSFCKFTLLGMGIQHKISK